MTASMMVVHAGGVLLETGGHIKNSLLFGSSSIMWLEGAVAPG
jgi:hypothetical protein